MHPAFIIVNKRLNPGMQVAIGKELPAPSQPSSYRILGYTLSDIFTDLLTPLAANLIFNSKTTS